MIEKIELNNFQSHKETVLNLSDGINIIAGSSDSGKSAILRALNWIIYNRPVGDAFISHWADNVKCEVVIDGNKVARIKNKKMNGYILNDKFLEAIRTDVPDEIITLLNIDDVNIQRQLDAPFLLSDTPGEVARFLNKIINLDVIDKVLFTVDKRKRETNDAFKKVTSEISNLEIDLNKYEFLDGLESQINYLLDYYDTYKNKANIFLSLSGTLNDIQNIKNEIDSLIIDDDMLDMIKECKDIQQNYNVVYEKYTTINKVINNIVECNKLLDKYSSVDEIYNDINDAKNLFEKYKDFSSKFLSIGYNISEYDTINNRLLIVNEELEMYCKEYNDICPDVCPLCGQPMKDKKVVL